MNPIKDTIGWAEFSWNPVVGCRRSPTCYYCYAKRMNDRFQWIPDWREPQFFPNRLDEPIKRKKPTTIFVGSMSDISYWKKEWTADVIEVCKKCPQHTFMFLTKDGYCYNRYEFPDNCQLGATIVGDILETYFRLNWLREAENKNRKYISIEPLLGSFENHDISFADLIIVGVMTGINPVKPKREWIDSIKHHNIFYKENIRKYL